jgi:hypothetical protein
LKAGSFLRPKSIVFKSASGTRPKSMAVNLLAHKSRNFNTLRCYVNY